MDKQVVINNLLTSYSETAGAGDGAKTLLFLHGWRSQAAVWRPVVESLKLSSYKVYALDLPGFGGSEVPKQSMTVGDYADIVAGFIKKLDLNNVILIGHSFGGRVGIKLASGHPELISKLILVDSAGFPMPPGRKNLYRMLAKIVKPVFKPKMMQALRKKIYQTIGAEDYLATPELQKTFVNITSEDLSEDMKRISCPSLIVNGENDTDTPVEFGEKMHSLISNSKFLILPNAGHFSFLDQPGEFIKGLLSFL